MTKILDMRLDAYLLLIYNLQLLKRKIEFDTVWLSHELNKLMQRIMKSICKKVKLNLFLDKL